MKTPYQVIKKPLITEKTTILREENKFTLVVDRNATKADIRQAAEEIFESEYRTCSWQDKRSINAC